MYITGLSNNTTNRLLPSQFQLFSRAKGGLNYQASLKTLQQYLVRNLLL